MDRTFTSLVAFIVTILVAMFGFWVLAGAVQFSGGEGITTEGVQRYFNEVWLNRRG